MKSEITEFKKTMESEKDGKLEFPPPKEIEIINLYNVHVNASAADDFTKHCGKRRNVHKKHFHKF